ncbi:NADPH-ferredoxin reductase FprA [Frankia canadensis]|uniref:ferredoxin--NADP(+) reductase n=1 Tax=Frankia canadensis TaxID=1836972 RepID=A0A2I2KXP2_9ACTN|nr:FAD-dependent oxidoreductase [Frankia canadensis]SNQ50435.1 NADPH-ferredoxin reductase FprA [Frankia canadensis]SOU57725.1 NADPH-ferredoxin reductase FprA [Frankia canadensis]
MSEGSVTAPLTVAVVGSGPSGFYAASSLLEQAGVDVRVDMYERLATPWGLVRSGVAPDHPKIKAVSGVYATIAAHENFRFFGNVHVGRDVTREELTARYDAVLYAVGAQSDRRLGIPGEDLPGSVSAVDFVGWYNGHPDYADQAFDLSGERAVVIGAGNVALDVARILCSPHDRLARTDIADHALAALRTSAITEVLVVGRRGATQAAFTTPELRELPEFTESGVDVDPAEVAEQPGEEALSRLVKRNLAVMRGYAAEPTERGARHITLRFQRTPVEIRGDGRVEEIVFARNALTTDADGWVSAVDTGERETVPTSLVLRAVGYRGVALDGLPFDDRRGVIPNEAGRVTGSDREYVAGWIKRGPTGIIGTNRKCAAESVGRLFADLDAGLLRRHDRGVAFDPVTEIETWLRGRQPHLVTENGWQLIDATERAYGEGAGRPRVKLVLTDELLDIALERETASR